jgi:glutathione S-transferase
MQLFDNPFSPFARKVRLVLDWKGLAYEVIDGLDKSNARALEAANGRVEVPALIDGDVTVANSSDIVAYLEHTHPEPPVYPADPAARVRARAWNAAPTPRSTRSWPTSRTGPGPSGRTRCRRA